ncbi:hypothetical protein [Flavobacterium branchiicola]|uniref:Uncharacterized protein n=1 Tax=Flavobacterium branchiicola TaxID=1114875 RepID=A0ABV9PDU2_9FLAO|nr:hypothetical protein [Flavobacterium branchiicola]MBS7254033.1 hypothetical protein [Flavobacterium branchiicola]
MKTEKMKLGNTEDILTRNSMANIIGGKLVVRDPNAGKDARLNGNTGSAPMDKRPDNSPMGAGTPYVNEQNELLYFGQAVANGVRLVASGVSWVADNVKVGIGTFGQPTITLK